MITPTVADAIFWIAVACCLVAQAAILRSVLTARAPLPARAGWTGPAPRRPIEIAWAVAPAVGLAVVLAATWRTLHPASADADRPAPAATAAVAPMVTR